MKQKLVRVLSLIALITGWLNVGLMWIIILLQGPLQVLFTKNPVLHNVKVFPVTAYVQATFVAILGTIVFIVIRKAKNIRTVRNTALICMGIGVGVHLIYGLLSLLITRLVGNMGMEYLSAYSSLNSIISIMSLPYTLVCNATSLLTVGAILGIAAYQGKEA